MPQELIETVIRSLEGLASSDRTEMGLVFASALASARASSSRALIPNTRIGLLARYSVAASASAPLRSYLASGTRSADRDALMRNAIEAAFKLAAGAALRGSEDAPEEATPEGWDKGPNGSYMLQTPIGLAEIAHSPHMPGGEWSLHLGGIPVGFGETPLHNALLLTEIIEFISPRPEARRHANPFGSRRTA
jgi:hypothetical protein